ncbi:MAG: amidohydrolase family protein [Actinobacteria bacterium]|nr:amidohydrolase family protein [Actinomycetota bacterium]
MLIDFHAHIYQDDAADKVIGRMEEYYGVRRRHDATLSSLLKSIGRAGFDRAVVLPVLTKPEHISLNHWYGGLGESSGGVLVPFGGIHPDNSPDELDLFPELGLRGMKLQPNAQRFYPDDPRMFPIYEKAQALGLMVVFHAGNEAAGPPAEFSRPDRFLPVLSSFPKLTVILTHLGGYKAWDKVQPLFPFKNACFDTAYLPGKIDEELFLDLVERIGINRVLFGTDFPFRDHGEELAWVERVLGHKDANVLHENAVRLLKL